MEPGISGDLNQRYLKSRERFARTRQMTGLEKETGVRECVAESPFCYKENCLLYIPENLKPMKREAGKRPGSLPDRSAIWCVPLTGIRWYCSHLIP